MAVLIDGNWKKGFAYDVHTLGSVYAGKNAYGKDQWNTTRSDMGELVYQLKYRGNMSTVETIVDLLGDSMDLEKMDAIIPVPSTNKNRVAQPVYEIARELGKRFNVTVLENVLQTQAGGQELKNVDDPDRRKELLKKQMNYTRSHNLVDKNVLLIDDLYRSGSTLSVATDLLYHQAGVRDVFALTMTKTRSRK